MTGVPVPKLSGEHFHIAGVSEDVTYLAAVKVDAMGIFHVGLDDKIVETAKALETGWQPLIMSAGYHESKPVVRAATLAACKSFIIACAKAYLKTTQVSTDVILYRYSGSVSYWRCKNGTIAPNGQGGVSDDPGWSGDERIHASRPGDGSIGLVALVCTKTVHIRGAATEVRYTQWNSPNNHGQTNDPKELLNRFLHGRLDAIKGKPDTHELPYSDDAALFFYRAMLSLCQIDHQLRSFFLNPDKVRTAIVAGGGPKLLT